MKLVFKSDKCSDVLSAILPETCESVDACREFLKLTKSIFRDGWRWNILHNKKSVCLIIDNDMYCLYKMED